MKSRKYGRVKEDNKYLVHIEYDYMRFKTPLFILITSKFGSNVIFHINQSLECKQARQERD